MCVSGFGGQHEQASGGKLHCFSYLVLSGSIACLLQPAMKNSNYTKPKYFITARNKY